MCCFGHAKPCQLCFWLYKNISQLHWVTAVNWITPDLRVLKLKPLVIRAKNKMPCSLSRSDTLEDVQRPGCNSVCSWQTVPRCGQYSARGHKLGKFVWKQKQVWWCNTEPTPLNLQRSYFWGNSSKSKPRVLFPLRELQKVVKRLRLI